MGLFGRIIVGLMPLTPKFVINRVARRYVAGSDLESAIALMQKMTVEGACFTIDVLGEEIQNISEARYFVDEYSRLIDEITVSKIDANLSLKPTAFGLLINEEIALENIEEIVHKASINNIFVRLDMENHRVTQPTIDIVYKMQSRGYYNIGTVLQSRLFRTTDDITQIVDHLAGLTDIRICKGIYLESSDIAETGYKEIVDATNSCIDLMLELGAYTAIASHDLPIINHALESLKKNGFKPGKPDPRTNAGESREGKGEGYEFQFLLGVRGNIRRKLSAGGHRTRVYIPYGTRWYEYSNRRLRENPDVAWHIVKALLLPWTNRR
ncbi:MAG: proline dehydrogenase [Methanobacteriota archaeon]|nr:MAG: proline dehydrogenase [Euryarchaeota archaeon]HIE64190.1 proline dehydrogenase [Candidatus Poseidoniales archaeon]HIK99640.1 proline dehydrogenase [Candidatus Poseidoniales archaeon]